MGVNIAESSAPAGGPPRGLFAALRVTREHCRAEGHCHTERSEASRCPPSEALRYAQGDNWGPLVGLFSRSGCGCGPSSDEPLFQGDPRRATFMVAPTDMDELLVV
jgi:hypothetical protein